MTDIGTMNMQELLAERDQRISCLEARLEDQERSLRHVLTMLIEWMEAEGAQKAA